jgi:amidase
MGRIPFGTQAGHALVGDVFFQQLGIEGPMGRTPQDVAQLLTVQAGVDNRAPFSQQSLTDFVHDLDKGIKGKRAAWLGDMNGHLAIEPALLKVYEQSLASFKTIGCSVEVGTLNIDLTSVWQSWLTLRGMTVAGNLSVFANNTVLRDWLKPEAIWEYEQGQRYTAFDVYKASAVRSSLYAAFLKLFESVDCIVLPAAQCMPFNLELDWPKSIAGRAMDTYHRWMECTIYATLAGLPAISISAGVLDGLPFGLQIIGKPQCERDLLQLASAWHDCVPTLQPTL